MTRCHEDPELLAYHDGELDPVRAREWASHVTDCAACRAQLRQWRALSRWLRDEQTAHEAAGEGPGTFAAIRERLDEIDAARAGAAPVVRARSREALARGGAARRRVRVRRVAAGLAVAAGLGGMLLFARGSTPPVDVIRSLDTFGAPVVVLADEAEDATVIWLIGGEEGIREDGGGANEPGRRLAGDASEPVDPERRRIDAERAAEEVQRAMLGATGEIAAEAGENTPLREARAPQGESLPGNPEAEHAPAP